MPEIYEKERLEQWRALAVRDVAPEQVWVGPWGSRPKAIKQARRWRIEHDASAEIQVRVFELVIQDDDPQATDEARRD